MINYFRESFKRKIARRFTREYPTRVDAFEIEGVGEVKFANWLNPLVKPVEFDVASIGFFRQFVKEGDFAIDIGSHTGDTTLPMAFCAGVSGLTMAFDPNPYVFKILEKNAELNKDKCNIVPLNCAISVKDEEYYFISSEASFSNGGISLTKKSRHGKFIHPEKVKGINLKSFLEKEYAQWLPKLTFIKVDTEGYDKEIIKSISGLIAERKPVIVAECFGKMPDADKIDLYETLDGLGYEIYYMPDFSSEVKMEKIATSTDILQWKKTIDICAKPKS